MSSFFCQNSRELTVLAVVFCVLLAQGLDDDQLGILAAFFTVIGDVLALFALNPGLCQTLYTPEEESAQDSDR